MVATRRRRSDGERSRRAILDEAVRLATVEGIEGLSIARLAQAVGMSKSGLFAHFGSKEELQLATVEAANAVFDERVLAPAVAGRGVERGRALADGFLRYVESGVHPGGCFFASVVAELDTRAGPVLDRAVGVEEEFQDRLRAAIRDGQAEGDIDPAEDVEQLAFEIIAYLLMANAQYVLARSPVSMERAGRALERRLAR